MAKRYTYIPNRVIDTNGISDGASIYFYLTGTEVPITIYSDASLTTPLPNPYTVNAGAAVPSIYHNESGNIRVRVVESGGEIVSDDDPYLDLARAEELVAVGGGGLVGFSQAVSYPDTTIGDKAQQRKSPLDAPWLAAGDAVTDDLTAINNAIAAAADIGEIDLAGATYRVSSAPTNPRGVHMIGGSVVIGTGSAAYQVNDYARSKGFVVGLEYAYRLYSRANQIGTTLTGFFYGDSTVAPPGSGGGYAGAEGTPDMLMTDQFHRRGVRNTINFTNRAVGGTDWADANPNGDTGVGTDIMFFKYAVNHVSGQDLDAEIAAMHSKLASLRAQTYGGVNNLTIVLVAPNSTDDTAGGRTSYWYERLRKAYEQAARDYKCVYVDIYGMFQDSTWWAGYYADTPAVHTVALLQDQIWAAVANALLPKGALSLSTGDRWRTLTGSNDWVAYGAGFPPPQAALSEDGWVRLRGSIARPTGTPTGGQVMMSMPNSSYYPPFSHTFPCTTFDGSAWSTTHLAIEVDGTLFPRDASAKNEYVSLDGMSWRVW